ncbi:hypothetical protein F5X96DRAFT_637736 [Biscogniauxia mediterranea]|nr:hypothetical protein F5X96DRAFT_637736 [Biscogniauxia mediterranea]
MSRALLITGATGKQGGSVIKALLDAKADFQILAVTRNASSASAKRLAAKSSNIVLVEGNLDDADGVFENAKKATSQPIWGVFSVQALALNKTGPVIEERQGKALVDAALKHGVKHFVYSSVDRHGARSSDNPTSVPHFASKHRIEQHLMQSARGADMGWTVLRPVAFMENFDGGLVGKIFATAWKVAVRSRPLQLVATADIGAFAVKAFTAPPEEEFNEKCISLAGDELTWEQMASVFRQKTGSEVPLTWGFVARFVLWLSREMGTMFDFFEKEGYGADIEELRKMHPDLQDFGTWLERSIYMKQ